MGSKHNIHQPGDDNYYYCPTGDCPCHDDDLHDHPASNVVNVNFGRTPDYCTDPDGPARDCPCAYCTTHNWGNPTGHQYTTTDSFLYLRARHNHPANYRPGA